MSRRSIVCYIELTRLQPRSTFTERVGSEPDRASYPSGTWHPEDGCRRYNIDCEQFRGRKDKFPCPVRDRDRISRSWPALQSCAQIAFYPWALSSRSLAARYWKDPRKFMPERFLGDWPRDAFIPFSQGRSCFVDTFYTRLKNTL